MGRGNDRHSWKDGKGATGRVDHGVDNGTSDKSVQKIFFAVKTMKQKSTPSVSNLE